MIGVAVYERDFNVSSAAERTFQGLGGFDATVPTAQHDDAGYVWHDSPLRKPSIVLSERKLSIGHAP